MVATSSADYESAGADIVPWHYIKHLVSGIWETTLSDLPQEPHEGFRPRDINIHIYNFKVTGKYNTYNPVLKNGGI